MSFFFFFNDTATTEIYTLSLHDALPICGEARARVRLHHAAAEAAGVLGLDRCADRGPLMGAATTRVWLGALVAGAPAARGHAPAGGGKRLRAGAGRGGRDHLPRGVHHETGATGAPGLG